MLLSCWLHAQAGKFLEKYGQMELFPVKMQVPLLMTVHIVMLSKYDVFWHPFRMLTLSITQSARG